jgi:hypothetical protein
MGMGPIIWTCLALTVHQAPVQQYHLNSRNVGIPIRINDKGRNDAQQFILLVSPDQGGTWQQVETKQLGEDKMFRFHAPSDGVYWFLVQQVDREGRTTPANPNRVKPTMAVIVDTVSPQVKVTAERLPSGEIRARWTVVDQYADAHSLHLEYHTRALPDGQWTELGAAPSLEGKHEFNPGRDGVTGEVRVRVRMKDQAGNLGEGEFVIPATSAAAAGVPAGPAEGSSFSLIPAVQAEPSRQPNQLTSRQAARPPLDPQPQVSPAPGAMLMTPTPPAELNPTGPGAGAPPAPVGGMPVAASSERMPAPPGGGVETPPASPAVKIVKAREVQLNFTVAKVGPSGLGNADVYVTLDKGASWKKLPGELPINLPANADLHGAEPVSGSVSVQLPAEGTIYGFIVAVKSKAGLAPPPPKPGDAPEILVELDTTAPKAQMFKPQPDPNQPDTLLLGWEAKDRNLAENPITLEWAEQKNGPWNPIGAGPMPNSGQFGQFAWRLPPQMPSRVYLRLTVRDLAGNEARAETDKPVLIDLSVPQTKIIGVAPHSR